MRTLGRLLCLLGLQFVASAAIATTIVFNPGFVSNDQSMWAPGTAASFSIDRFLGVQWNESASVGGIFLTPLN